METEVYEEPRYQMHIQTHGNVYPHTKPLPMPCWISPDGKVYHCHGYEHVWLAGRIMRTIHGERHIEGGWDAARALEKLGYIKVWESGAISSLFDDTLTQAQLNALDDLSKFEDSFGWNVKKGLQDRLKLFDNLQNSPTVVVPANLPSIDDWE